MSFPDWGHSYNALYVPLKSGWQCALVPARDIEDVDRGWRLSYEERQKARKEREEQMEQDRRDFDHLFRVSISRGASRISGDYNAYASFISEHVSGRWHTPIDGEDITRILREAVREGLIVPAIDRNWRGSYGLSKRYAPQTWPKRAPDPKPTVYGVRNGEFVPLDASGRFIDRTPYVPVAATASNVAGSRGGADWPGAIGTAAGALLGSGDSGGGDDTQDPAEGMVDDSAEGDIPDVSTPLGDAQPFEYSAGGAIGDAEQDAGVFLTPAEEVECETQYEADMAECSAYAAMDRSSWGMCKERAMNRYASCLRGVG